MGEKQLIAELKRWLARDGNSAAKLATLLGYSSSAAIQMWLSRGSVPKWQRERVTKIIKKGPKE